MKKVAVILSGAGVYDGTEIHEATLALYFLDKAGIAYTCVAPNMNQISVVNHLNASDASVSSRHVLEESARIARGPVLPIQDLNLDEIDGLILPGGFGAAKNLSNFATKVADCTIQKEVSDSSSECDKDCANS